jgi:RNA polymerase sigma-70 factor (ECF subfamily)
MSIPDRPPDPDDASFRTLVESGDLEGATTQFMERFGGDILAFLVVQLRDPSNASEVFSQFAEDFWRGLAGFQWRTTLRGWGYTLACNAAARFQRSQRRREVRRVRPPRTPQCAQVRRSSTAAYLRTEVKNRMRALRLQLPVDDQSLLLLRIDKGLSWNELAVIFSGQSEAEEEAEMVRSAARLRQRFAAIKRRLKGLARKEGLI